MTKLFLVDGNSIICRYFYGLSEKKSPDGINVNGVFGFTRFLSKFLKEEGLKDNFSIVVMFDKASRNFRKKISPIYKKNRIPFSENFFQQMKLCEEICQNYNIPMDYHEEYEADDLIATYCKKYKNNYTKIVIISNDKDLLQLVDKQIEVYNVAKKTIFQESDVEKFMHVKAHQIAEFLAIAGDASDNISGICGVGPKTTAKLLKKYSTLENIIQSEEGVKKDFSPALDFLKLTQLYCDAPIKNNILIYYHLPGEQIFHCLERYGFFELMYLFRES